MHIYVNNGSAMKIKQGKGIDHCEKCYFRQKIPKDSSDEDVTRLK